MRAKRRSLVGHARGRPGAPAPQTPRPFAGTGPTEGQRGPRNSHPPRRYSGRCPSSIPRSPWNAARGVSVPRPARSVRHCRKECRGTPPLPPQKHPTPTPAKNHTHHTESRLNPETQGGPKGVTKNTESIPTADASIPTTAEHGEDQSEKRNPAPTPRENRTGRGRERMRRTERQGKAGTRLHAHEATARPITGLVFHARGTSGSTWNFGMPRNAVRITRSGGIPTPTLHREPDPQAESVLNPKRHVEEQEGVPEENTEETATTGPTPPYQAVSSTAKIRCDEREIVAC